MAWAYAELRDEGGRRFDDVTGELTRTYVAEGRSPLRIHGAVAASDGAGSHRVWDSDGVSHWVGPGFEACVVVGADRSIRAGAGTGAAAGESGVGATIDVASEAWREYRHADGSTARVDDPIVVEVRPDGSHRVAAVGRDPVEVAAGFVAIRWQARRHAPNFVR